MYSVKKKHYKKLYWLVSGVSVGKVVNNTNSPIAIIGTYTAKCSIVPADS